MISTVVLISLATCAVSSQYSGFPSINNSAGQLPTGRNPNFPTRLDPGYPTEQFPDYPTGKDPDYPTRQDRGYPIGPELSYLIRQDPGYLTGQNPSYQTRQNSGYPTRQNPGFKPGLSDLSAKEIPSFPYVQVSDLLAGQVLGYPTRQDPGYLTRQGPGYLTGQVPGYSTKQDLGFQTGQISDLSAKEISSFPYIQGPGSPTRQSSGFPYVKVSNLAAIQKTKSGKVPSFPEQDPSFPTSPDFSTRQVPNFPVRQVFSYPGWPPGSPISGYLPIQGIPIDYIQKSKLLDKHDQDLSLSAMVRVPKIPLYTSLLKDFDQAVQEVYKHIKLFTGDALTSLPENNPLIQYIAIVFTINEMTEALAREIPVTTESVLDTYKEACRNPTAAASVVSSRLNKTTNQIALIREFITQKQRTDCKTPDSYECNLIIDKALASSTDLFLKQQARLLASLGQELKLFNTDYATEFDKISKNGNARNYLKNAYERRLKPFLEAAVKVRRSGFDAPLVWFGA